MFLELERALVACMFAKWVAGHFAERHFAERHFAESHFAERHFAERTICRMDYLPNGLFAERAFFRQDFLKNNEKTKRIFYHKAHVFLSSFPIQNYILTIVNKKYK